MVVREFGLESFEVLTLALERTLVEKILALVRAGYAADPVAELQAKVRHAYDLHQLLQQAELRVSLAGAGFADLLAEVRADDARNQEFQGDWMARPLREAAPFSDGRRIWQRLVPTYQGYFGSWCTGHCPSSRQLPIRSPLSGPGYNNCPEGDAGTVAVHRQRIGSPSRECAVLYVDCLSRRAAKEGTAKVAAAMLPG